jgi:hypothetical protein
MGYIGVIGAIGNWASGCFGNEYPSFHVHLYLFPPGIDGAVFLPHKNLFVFGYSQGMSNMLPEGFFLKGYFRIYGRFDLFLHVAALKREECRYKGCLLCYGFPWFPPVSTIRLLHKEQVLFNSPGQQVVEVLQCTSCRQGNGARAIGDPCFQCKVTPCFTSFAALTALSYQFFPAYP